MTRNGIILARILLFAGGTTWGGTTTTIAGDDVLATETPLVVSMDAALDSGGNLYIADPFNHRIRRATSETRNDGRVDFFDFLPFATAFVLTSSGSGFDSNFDLNQKGAADFVDFVSAFGT